MSFYNPLSYNVVLTEEESWQINWLQKPQLEMRLLTQITIQKALLFYLNLVPFLWFSRECCLWNDCVPVRIKIKYSTDNIVPLLLGLRSSIVLLSFQYPDWCPGRTDLKSSVLWHHVLESKPKINITIIIIIIISKGSVSHINCDIDAHLQLW